MNNSTLVEGLKSINDSNMSDSSKKKGSNIYINEKKYPMTQTHEVKS
jgi:hypothetical protein